MTAHDYLNFIVDEIHSAVVATVDSDGLPVTCVIDMMYADENGLYFLTAKGKNFYQRLKDKGYLALSGKKGEDTMSCTAISVRGKVRELGLFYANKVCCHCGVRPNNILDLYGTDYRCANRLRAKDTVFYVYILSLLQNHIGNNYPPCSATVFCGGVYYFLCGLGQKFVGCGGVALNDVKDVRGIFVNSCFVHLPDLQTAKNFI